MSYFSEQLSAQGLKDAVETAIQYLDGLGFDDIICRGNSGLVFAAPLAMLTGKNLWIVRKKTDNSHSSNLVEGVYGASVGRILIVDDFVASGATIREIAFAIRQRFDEEAIDNLVGIYQYGRDYTRTYKFDVSDECSKEKKFIPMWTSECSRDLALSRRKRF